MKTEQTETAWYGVPAVWLILFLLTAMVLGSFALLAAALEHPDALKQTPRPLANPLPPSHAQRPADASTP